MNHFGIFAKHWTPGRVKTRLAASIGDHAAAEIYRRFVATLTTNLSCVADSREVSILPYETARIEFAALASDAWRITPQADGDLGEKMNSYFETAFAHGAKQVVLIGSDSPLLMPQHISQAFAALASSEVVLGPTNDGGYYLVGAANSSPPIFENINWSTPSVWKQTISRLNSAKLSYSTLPPQIDVDDYADLKQLFDSMTAAHQTSDELYQVVRNHTRL